MNRSQDFNSCNHFSSLKQVEDRLASEGKKERKKKRYVSSSSPQSQDFSNVEELNVSQKRKKHNVVENLHENIDHQIEQIGSPLFLGYNQPLDPVSLTGSLTAFSLHKSFFSSLGQVESRLALENKEKKQNRAIAKYSRNSESLLNVKNQNRAIAKYSRNRGSLLNVKDLFTPEKREGDDIKETLSFHPSYHPAEQLSPPLFIGVNGTTNMVNASGSAALNQESEPPWEFISHPPNVFSDDSNMCHSVPSGCGDNEEYENGEKRYDDDIKQLMRLLGLLAVPDKAGDHYCLCSGGNFRSKIVGVKGPKCGQERRRLDGWIEYYHSQNSEPVRLAHLLLAKAVCMSEEDISSCQGIDDLGFRGVEFPSTMQEYLKQDPPQHMSS